MKILCVEDGSVDLNALEEEPLRDGKVLVYKQGSKSPFVLEIGEGYTYKKFWEILKSQINITIENAPSSVRHYFVDFLKTMELIEKGELITNTNLKN